VGGAAAREVLVSGGSCDLGQRISQISLRSHQALSSGAELNTQSFADLGVSPVVARALSERGLKHPFPVQASVIPDALAGHDVLVKSPTGSGKTLALGVPLVDRIEATDPRAAALVLAPTRELASQIVEEIRDLAAARALSVAAVYGGVGIERQAKLARKAHILVATPGRLEDLIARGAVRLDRVRVLALDEADRMLDMGFRPVVDRIVRQVPRERQTFFLSATLDGEAGRIAAEYTRNARRHEHAPTKHARVDIDHRFLAVAHEDKVDSLVRALRGDDAGRTLVFVRTKRGADRLVKRLGKRGVEAAAMHGDKSQGQREKALRRFHRGEVAALVATDVAARGIDVDDITQVVNFDAPEDRETYVHRIGRTARAGRSGVGVTFVMHDQAHDVGKIAHELRLHAQFEQSGLRSSRPGTVHRGGRRHPSRSGRRSRVR
jgi:superfamily II DNA/RNA helicase